jgi:hypothetical protein
MSALEIAENQMNGTQNIDINTDNNELREVVIVSKYQNRKKEKKFLIK